MRLGPICKIWLADDVIGAAGAGLMQREPRPNPVLLGVFPTPPERCVDSGKVGLSDDRWKNLRTLLSVLSG